MRKAPGWAKLLFRGWVCVLLLCVLLGAPMPGLVAQAQGLGEKVIDEVRYIEPKLGADIDPYDPAHPEALDPGHLYAKAAILIEANSGEVIFEKNADDIMYPASTTKILTVLLGLMMGDMNQTVTLSETAGDLPEDSATIPLKVGESINFQDLLYATRVRSGNEGANLIAETIAGSNNDFAALMNQAAAMYGCTSTHFVNPSGLHHSEHYSTARDMAKIAKAAMENEQFRSIAQTYTYRLGASNLSRAQVLVSSADALLNNSEDNEYYYRYARGVKTGYHSHAGYCYVGAAKRGNVQLISVVFYTSRSGRWTDTAKLMEYGFTQYVSMTPTEMYLQNPITIETSGFSMDDPNLGRLQLRLVPQGNAYEGGITATRVEIENMARNLKQIALIDYTRSFSAPIAMGEKIGELTYYPPDENDALDWDKTDADQADKGGTEGNNKVVYDLVASRSVERRLNAPKSIEEIEAEVYADPNPFPPFSLEMLAMVLAPFVGAFIVIRLLMRLFRRTGRHKKGRVPRPGNRYFR